MDSGYRQIFWGLFFSTFHLNLGPLQILPSFVGWLIIAGGVSKLMNENQIASFRKANYCSLGVAAVYFAGFFISLNPEYQERFAYLPMLGVIITYPFVYYLMAGSIWCLRASGKEEAADENESSLRAFMIIYVLNSVLAFFALAIVSNGLTFLCAVIGVLQNIWLMLLASRLKTNYLGETMPEENNNSADS